MLKERERQRTANSGSFKPGNQVALGNRGGQTVARRQTNQIISKSIFHALHEMDPTDPKRIRTKADALVRACLKRGIQEGDIAVLKALVDRMEGSAINRVAFKDFTDEPRKYRMITSQMTDKEAFDIVQNMIREDDGEGFDESLVYESDDDVAVQQPWHSKDWTPPRPSIIEAKPIEGSKPEFTNTRDGRRLADKYRLAARRAKRR